MQNSKLKGKEYNYKSTDKGGKRYIHQLDQRITSELTLKVGAFVMLRKNRSRLLVNGSTGTIVDFQPGEKDTGLCPVVNFGEGGGQVVIERGIYCAVF